MTRTLPRRLRALATFIDQHELPEPSITLHPSGYTALTVENLSELRAWAVAFGSKVTAMHVEPGEGRTPFVAHQTTGLVGGKALGVAFYDHDHDQVRAAKHAPQAVTA